MKKLLNPIFVIILFSALHINSFVPINPFYIGVILSLLLYFLFFSINPQKSFLSFYHDDYFIFFVILFYVFHILLNTFIIGVPIKYPIFMAISPLFFFTGFSLKYIKINILKLSFSGLKYFSLILFAVDCIYRLTHPTIAEHGFGTSPMAFIYAFKLNGIIFNDTNSTGFLLATLICFFLYLKEYKLLKFSFIEITIFFIFLVLTFSRAALIGFIFCMFVIYFFNKRTVTVKAIIVFLFIYIGTHAFIYILSDNSFKSKLMIFESTYNYLKNVNIWDFMFGIGYDNSRNVLNIYAHNYISLHFIEFGLIGLLTFIIMICVIFIKQAKIAYLLIPFLVTGLSFTPTYLPYFYLYLGLIFNLERKFKEA